MAAEEEDWFFGEIAEEYWLGDGFVDYDGLDVFLTCIRDLFGAHARDWARHDGK